MLFSKLALLLSILTVMAIVFDVWSAPRSVKRTSRTPEYGAVDRIFVDRWSPRAMSGEPMSVDQLMVLFEAARWAPSSYNEQPWRFLYAMRDSADWNTFLDLLVPANQTWAKNGSALIVIISKNTSSRGGLNALHTFDTGSAWENLALQGSLLGLVVHGMAGFDYEKARTVLHIPADYTVEAMCIVGKPGNVDSLPEGLRAHETVTDRMPIEKIAMEGKYRASL